MTYVLFITHSVASGRQSRFHSKQVLPDGMMSDAVRWRHRPRVYGHSDQRGQHSDRLLRKVQGTTGHPGRPGGHDEEREGGHQGYLWRVWDDNVQDRKGVLVRRISSFERDGPVGRCSDGTTLRSRKRGFGRPGDHIEYGLEQARFFRVRLLQRAAGFTPRTPASRPLVRLVVFRRAPPDDCRSGACPNKASSFGWSGSHRPLGNINARCIQG